MDKRRGPLNQRRPDDIVPSPGHYTLKTTFEENKSRAYLIDRPRDRFLELQASKNDESSIVLKRREEDRKRGPGLYPVHQ